MNPESSGEARPNPERDPSFQPRIYVASLSDYNAGRLHGRWVDPTTGIDSVTTEVQQMLSQSSEPVAEEYAIHDYEGWGPLRLSEYEHLETICRLDEGIETNGEAYARLAAPLDRGDWHLLDRFDELYQGHWDSSEEYAANLLEDMGVDIDHLGPDFLQQYVRVDLESFGRDLADDLVICDTEKGGIHVFDRH